MGTKKLSASTVLFALIASVAVVYCTLCGLGVTNTFWGWDARHSSIIWKIVMFIPLVIAANLIIALTKNKVVATPGLGITLFVLIGLGFACSTGFKFTGGDIKQRVSYLNNKGQVTDTSLLFNCYDAFYNFSDNPELKQYVRDYGELPGRNVHNQFIIDGDIPKSTAPRADENFSWHTGAYEMDLSNKNCR